MSHGILETATVYRPATEELERALIFPEHDPEAVLDLYANFIRENDLPPFGAYPTRCNHTPDYTEMCFAATQVPFTLGKKMADDEAKRMRNEHLDSFVDYLFAHDIQVAENLPIAFTKATIARLNNIE